MIFAILYLIVTLIAVGINIAFFCMYKKHFDSLRLPMDYERRVRLGKGTYSEFKKFREPVDEKFDNFKTLNRPWVIIIYICMVLFGF
jgi:hypothetical protein